MEEEEKRQEKSGRSRTESRRRKVSVDKRRGNRIRKINRIRR